MAGSVNKAILIGSVGRDPEIRTTRDGDKIANISLATSESWQDKQSGERKERTEWHRVVVMNTRTAEVAERFVKKGSKIYVEGQLQTRKWTDQSGVEKYTTEIVVGRFNGSLVLLGDRQDGSQSSHERREAPKVNNRDRDESYDNDLNDEVPF